MVLGSKDESSEIEDALGALTEGQRQILEDEADTYIDEKILPLLSTGVFTERCGHLIRPIGDDEFLIISLKQKTNGATNIVLYMDEAEKNLLASAYTF